MLWPSGGGVKESYLTLASTPPEIRGMKRRGNAWMNYWLWCDRVITRNYRHVNCNISEPEHDETIMNRDRLLLPRAIAIAWRVGTTTTIATTATTVYRVGKRQPV